MIEIEGNFGKCIFCDNMDKDVGLPSIKDREFSLCLTDPPYSVEMDPEKQKKDAEKRSGKIYETNELIAYEDNMDWETKMNIMLECFRVSGFTMFTPGLKEFTKWIKEMKPTDIIYWHKLNSRGKTSHFSTIRVEPVLVYGKISDQLPFSTNLITNRLMNGFAKKDQSKQMNHPSPKEPAFYRDLILNYTKKIDSVIDPFLGSGTTGMVCEELGIPWLGFEKKEEYFNTIKERINEGIGNHKTYKNQANLTRFLWREQDE